MARSDVDLWHRRMGHVCDKSLDKLKALYEINFKRKSKNPFIVCVKGKQTRRPIREDGTRATKLLELVHSDFVGPFNVSSFSGARFLVTFVDDYSKRLVV